MSQNKTDSIDLQVKRKMPSIAFDSIEKSPFNVFYFITNLQKRTMHQAEKSEIM